MDNGELTLSELEHAYYEYTQQINSIEMKKNELVQMVNSIVNKIEMKKVKSKIEAEIIEKNKIDNGGKTCQQV